MFKFEKLDAWQKAIDFADLVYSETKSFPPLERFELTSRCGEQAAEGQGVMLGSLRRTLVRNNG